MCFGDAYEDRIDVKSVVMSCPCSSIDAGGVVYRHATRVGGTGFKPPPQGTVCFEPKDTLKLGYVGVRDCSRSRRVSRAVGYSLLME